MTEKRIGNQEPTESIFLPYEKTKSAEALTIYRKTKRKPQEWQKLLMNNILAVNDDGLWTHTRFGYTDILQPLKVKF